MTAYIVFEFTVGNFIEVATRFSLSQD